MSELATSSGSGEADDKGLKVATNTIVPIGLALALGGIGLLADMLVQLNKRRHDVMPATVVSGQPRSPPVT